MENDPDLAAVLEADKRAVASTISGDVDAFAASIAPNCLVNAPNNQVVEGADTIKAFRAGMISYSSFDRRIERAARLGDRVVTMGEETMTPKGNAPHAGKTIKRRFTDVWGKIDGAWRIELRQATIIAVE